MPSAPTELPIVRVDPQDTEVMSAWSDAMSIVFLQSPPTAEQVAERQQRMADHRLFAARDGARTVATFRSFDSDLTVPGARDPLAVNAISSVTVLPTHRRRLLLSRWMEAELQQTGDRGVPVSILIASEAGIYGRFGFGVATRSTRWTVNALAASFRTPPVGSVEIVDTQTFLQAAPGVYDAARSLHPGAISRPLSRWELVAQTSAAVAEPDRRRRFALHRAPDGQLDGLLAYTVEDGEQDRVSTTRLVVQDLWAASAEAYTDLWRYCCEVDFVATVVADDRSPHEPLPLLLSDYRTARDGATSDFLWVRLHDVPAALQARRYPVPGRLLLDVSDRLGMAAGRFVLEVDEDGRGRCEPDRGSTQPDLRLDAAALASMWLGDGHPGVLARAGAVSAKDPAALARATALFGWHQPAFCGTWF